MVYELGEVAVAESKSGAMAVMAGRRRRVGMWVGERGTKRTKEWLRAPELTSEIAVSRSRRLNWMMVRGMPCRTTGRRR